MKAQEDFRKFVSLLYEMYREGMTVIDEKKEYAGRHISIKMLRDAKRVLAPRQKQAFDLVFEKGMKQQDAADEMKMAQPNIVRYTSTALSKMRGYLFK